MNNLHDSNESPLDILDRLRGELARSRSMEERSRQLLETAPDAIVVVDRRGRIVLMNAQVEALFGYTKEELLGQSIEILVPERLRQRHEAHRNSFVSNYSTRPMGSGFNLEARRKDGQEVAVEISLSPVETADGLLVSAAIRDITERRAVQEALRQARDELELRVKERTEELERANRALQAEIEDRRNAELALYQAQKMEAVGQLTGGVAHDFNNLLTVINGNLQILSHYCRDDAFSQELIEAALKSGRRGAELNRTLLAFSRRQRLVPVLIEVSELVNGIAGMLRRTLGETVEIDILAERKLPKALADPAQLEAALLNLAVNARDAMPRGGKLLIETGQLNLDPRAAALEGDVKPGLYIVLSVSDTGIGMPVEVSARAFEPFFTTKETGKGSGLGLAQVYGFAKQSGGHVKIYSVEERGTTIKLFLPVSVEQNEQKLVEPETPLRRGGSETILIVEDEEDVRALACRILRGLGYRILEAQDGPGATRLLESDQSIDLLFTDVVLPGGMYGPDIAQLAQTKRPDLPVLYTSGYTGNAIRQLDEAQQEVRLITKPYAIEDLAREVRSVLDESLL